MARIRYYLGSNDLEADIDIELELCCGGIGNGYQIFSCGVKVCDIKYGRVFFLNDCLNRVSLNWRKSAWILGGKSQTKIELIVRGLSYYFEGDEVATIKFGGSIFRSIFELLRGNGWIEPRVYHEIYFDEALILPEYALSILVVDTES
ncbi:hypothetical protein L4D06_17615 [Enterovibrio makurazakiensis]|uniref:hypothetical protein n=1 Tax=Enterovibrio makurazakiensis TaxID=2910232 RepID=UPI003D1B772E